ncbi:MAG TPA: ABC transporter permease [Candidatus Angelobacter sp.]|nr:ABC transporter permease [Candidatus Angelobacter sp.]
MSLRNIGIVYRKELREALRDRRTVIASVVIPLFLFPLLSVGFGTLVSSIVDKTREASPKIMVIGGDDSPGVLASLKATPKVEIVPAAPNWKDLIIEKQIPAAIEIPQGFDKSVVDQKKLDVMIYNYSGDLKSDIAAGKMDTALKAYRDDVVKKRVVAQKLPVEVLEPFEVTQKNIAPPEKSGAALFFGGFIAYIVVFLCFNGGMHPAIDLTAGEKERGTMETILSSPISRAHLVVGKFLLVLTTALSTAALSVISMGISFALVNVLHGKTIQAGNEGPAMHIGVGAALSVFIMAVPLAVLFSSILLMIASFAKSYKEAQTYIVPMVFIIIIPAIAAMLPGVDLNAKLALVPILNVSLLCKELVIGTYHWNYIAIIFTSTCAYAAVALFLAVKMFQRESVLFRS